MAQPSATSTAPPASVSTFQSPAHITNFMRLLCLLNETTSTYLRQIFYKLWAEETQKSWTNIPQDGVQLIEGIGMSLHHKAQKIQKRMLVEGNCEKWDLPLLVDVLKVFKSSRIQSKDLDGLKELRNQIAHMGKVSLESEEFEGYWKKATSILISLGITQDEIDLARTLKISEDTDDTRNRSPEPVTPIIEECKKLKNEGNELYRKQKFAEAVLIYTEAISLEGVPNKELAILYSNRSAAHISAGNREEGKFDAKSCITLHPMWFRGYYRLAKYYEVMQKYDKALDRYEMSLMLKPGSKEIEEARDYCRILLGRQERQDHLDPMQQLTTRVALDEQMKRLGQNVMPGVSNSVQSNFLAGLPAGICGMAHKHLHGMDGYKVDYEKAAQLFAQAARKGSAEGLYNLAQLTREGKGVKRSVEEGHQLLLQAANQDSKTEALPGSGVLIKNVGVAEAQHSLGLAYHNGIGVEVDYSQARAWYTKALANGAGASANNLASMYCNGNCVVPDLKKAILYWKLATLKGITRAAENLAETYLQLGRPELAREWYLYGVHGGSSILVWQKGKFGITAEMEHAFNPQQFETKLKTELLQSELSHLATTMSEDVHHGIPSNILQAMSKRSAPNLPKNDKRHILIKSIRNGINTDQISPVLREAGVGNLVPKVDVDLVGLKPVTLKEFDEKLDDKIYEGFILKVVVIEDAHIRASSIFLVVEDEDRNVERVFVYNYHKSGNVQHEIGYGTKFSIVNPYFRKMADGAFGIRIDDPNTIFRHAALADPKRCRYSLCGKPNSSIPCRKCKRSFYCDKLCMKKDSKELQHELVCFKKLK